MQQDQASSAGLLHRDLSPAYFIAGTVFLLLLLLNFFGGYGLFRDELYYIACTNHLATGYVDHPPLSVFLLKLQILLFGDSLFSVRFIPAVTCALIVVLTGAIARELGGNRIGIFLACLFSVSPILLAMSSFYSMNSLEILSWTTAAYLVVRIVKNGRPSHWILLGIILGLGLLNKIGVLFLGAGIAAGLLLTPARRWFATPWPYVAGLISLIFFLPYIIWNFNNDFAHLEFIRNASEGKYSGLSVLAFLSGQLMMNQPIGAIVWISGLFALFFHKDLKRFRILGIMYVVPLVILLLNKTSKDVYLAPAYPMLWAGAGVWLAAMTIRFNYARYIVGLVGLVWFVTSVALLPMVLPVLPVAKYTVYSKKLGMQPSSAEGKELAELHQFYADMFGWKEKVETVSAAFNSLSPEEKAKCAILGSNYGRCAAVDYYADEYGLPQTIGNHNNYWIWGPRDYTGEVMIIMGGSYEDHADDFEEVILFATSDCTYCMPYEDNMPVFIARHLKMDLRSIWPEEKHFE